MNHQQPRAAKRTHRLQPEISVLWIPDLCGYLLKFSLGNFSVIENADMAMHLAGDRASVTAANFRKATGFRVAVRPYRNTRQA